MAEKIIGEIIRQKIREDGRTAKVICEEMDMSRGNLDKIYHKDSLNSDLLAKFCLVLKHDFFRYVNPFRKSADATPVISLYNNEVHEEQAAYYSNYDDLQAAMKELEHASRELDFLSRTLDDLKNSLRDKDEIIQLQKEKIAFLEAKLGPQKE